jgi:hypothetical protein
VPDKAISPEDLFCLQQGSPPHSRRVAVRNWARLSVWSKTS